MLTAMGRTNKSPRTHRAECLGQCLAQALSLAVRRLGRRDHLVPDLGWRNSLPPGQHAVVDSVDEALDWRHPHHTRALPLLELGEPEPVPEGQVCQTNADRPPMADGASDRGIPQPGYEGLQSGALRQTRPKRGRLQMFAKTGAAAASRRLD